MGAVYGQKKWTPGGLHILDTLCYRGLAHVLNLPQDSLQQFMLECVPVKWGVIHSTHIPGGLYVCDWSLYVDAIAANGAVGEHTRLHKAYNGLSELRDKVDKDKGAQDPQDYGDTVHFEHFLWLDRLSVKYQSTLAQVMPRLAMELKYTNYREQYCMCTIQDTLTDAARQAKKRIDSCSK